LAASLQGSTGLPEHEIEAPGHTTTPPPLLLDDPLDALLLAPPLPPLLDALPPLPPALAVLDALPPLPPAPPLPVTEVLAVDPPVDVVDPPPPPPPPPPWLLLHPTEPRMAVTTRAAREHAFDIFEVLPEGLGRSDDEPADRARGPLYWPLPRVSSSPRTPRAQSIFPRRRATLRVDAMLGSPALSG
jgi:hypothetical protein